MRWFAVLAAGVLCAGPALAADPWVIGIIAPTTGPIATVGTRQLSAVQWWAQAVNAKGGIKGRPIQVANCDDAGNPEKAVTCARDLLAKGSVLMLNASVTGPILATMPLVANGPVMITPSPNVLPPADGFVFQTSASDPQVTQCIANYMKANHVDKLGTIAATDASGEVGVHSTQTVFPQNGITYRLARIDLKANDASIQLADVAKGMPLIYSNYSGAGAATVVKSYNNLGLDQPLMVSYANISNAFISVIKDDMPPRLLGIAIRAVVPSLVDDASERGHIEAVEAAYKEWKHDDPDNLTLQGIILADVAEAVLRNVADPTDAKAVRHYLETTPVDSVQTVHFSPTSHIGMGVNDLAIVEWKDGHWIKANPL
jgi:branched-chain amino acid transport system substrate-binding protein